MLNMPNPLHMLKTSPAITLMALCLTTAAFGQASPLPALAGSPALRAVTGLANNRPGPSAPAKDATVTLTTVPSPARKGSDTFQVRLTDAAGTPVAGANVTVTLTMPAMPEMNMAAMKTVVTPLDKGHGMYEGKGDLGSGGIWQVTVTATRNGKTLAKKQLTLHVE